MRLWWVRLSRYALPHGRGLLLVLLFMLVGIGLDVLKPWPLKLIVDYVLKDLPLPAAVSSIKALPGGTSSLGLLGWLCAATVFLFLASEVVDLAHKYVQAGVGTRMVYSLATVLFDHLQRLSIRFHSRQRAGDLVRRVTNDSGCVRELVMGAFLPALNSLVSIGFMFAVMCQLDRFLALLALLIAPLQGILIRLFSRPMTERSYQYHQFEGQRMALAEQILTALPVVKAFCREEYEDERWRGLSTRALRAYLRTILSQLQFKIGVSGTTAIGTAVVMAIGGLHVLQGTLTVGSLLVFLSYLASLYGPMETLAYLSSGLASSAASSRRVLEMLDADEGIKDSPEAQPLPVGSSGPRGHVSFHGVTFGYEPGRPVLKDITLEAYPGETVALVGPTGAGKSTLVSLIPRLFDPWEGRVIFDGLDVRNVQLTSLRAHVALVMQEPFLLPLTVAENIAYSRPSASREEIVSAAIGANADEFISELPERYDTLIGERGATLSGGQKQRLAIARALLKDASVLILDEPSSSLDAETEALLMAALKRLTEGRTTFIIAHRLSTIRQANRIVMLEKGRILESGTHKELLARGGLYETFHRLQFGTHNAVSNINVHDGG
jgi:ATP-binding cassette subfamily B protein